MTHRPASPTSRHFWHTATTTAHPDDIWSVWTDVANWHTWDKGLKSATLQGTFRKGALGSLVSLNGQTSRFTITEFHDRKSYTFTTALPLARLNVKRSWTSDGARTHFTHEVWFDGLLGGVFAMLLGKNFWAILPSVMEEVAKNAEAKSNVRPKSHSTP